MTVRRIRRGDFYSGLALAALGAFIVREAWQWEYLAPDGPGPGFFPRWYGLAMIALSLVLVLGSLRASPAPKESPIVYAGIRSALALWTVLVVCIALIGPIGFFASFALLCWGVATLLFGQRQIVALAVAIAMAVAFWLVFDYALGVGLPRGAWWV